MKKSEWNEGLNNIDIELVEKYIAQKDLFAKRRRTRKTIVRVAAIAACVAILFGTIAAVPMLWDANNNLSDGWQIGDSFLDGFSSLFEKVFGQPEPPEEDNNVFSAWTGDFSDVSFKAAIEEYQKNYKTINAKEQGSKVSFDVEYDVLSCSVSRLSYVDKTNFETELYSNIDKYVKVNIDGRSISVSIDWWYKGNNGERLWSYLVRVIDKQGDAHYYYFRVDYSDPEQDYIENNNFVYNFHRYIDDLNFDEKTSESDLKAQGETYKYNGKSINSLMLGEYADGLDGGGYSAFDISGDFRFSYATLATFYDDEGYAIYSDYFNTNVPLEGLWLPGEISFGDNILEVFEKLEIDIYSEEILSTYKDNTLIICENENEILKLHKLENGGFNLIYIENYISEYDNKSEVTRNLFLKFTEESGCTLSGLYVSVDTKYYYNTNKTQNVLNAWSGAFYENQYKIAIQEYTNKYESIAFEEGLSSVNFTTKYNVMSCSVVRVAAVDENNPDFELLEGVTDFPFETSFKENSVNIPIYSAESVPENSIVSYLVHVETIQGYNIYYYFRVDYSKKEADSSKKYFVDVYNPDGFEFEEELKDSYAAGEKVTIKLKYGKDCTVSVNGEELKRDTSVSDSRVRYYTFTMPESNVYVTIKEVKWVVVQPVVPEDYEKALEVSVENGVFHYEQLNSCDITIYTDDDLISFENDVFLEKLRNMVDGKEAIQELCDCQRLYYVGIDNHQFELHSHCMIISVPYEQSAWYMYAIECSEEDMNELLAILEAQLQNE